MQSRKGPEHATLEQVCATVLYSFTLDTNGKRYGGGGNPVQNLGRMGGWMDIWVGARTDGWMGVWVSGWMDGQTDNGWVGKYPVRRK